MYNPLGVDRNYAHYDARLKTKAKQAVVRDFPQSPGLRSPSLPFLHPDSFSFVQLHVNISIVFTASTILIYTLSQKIYTKVIVVLQNLNTARRGKFGLAMQSKIRGPFIKSVMTRHLDLERELN
jgi:hypothetical protein